ncbi:cytochrome P450 family protein [Streptomonospora wellingtoniae]|uniref:Cytochrome P450 n=1 Tax=Streptomonospora wellingtoniae TaxID=3075544 RepID=A0ABU2KNF9_9ACTN|nr:cytochrome P450 [Streptomonospora sp. DSM 45055]MDT0300804.1 cytochrome P450 [Streptomonospora sp. DSM 45055]
MTGHSAVAEVLAHPAVKKDPRHWRAWRDGEIPPDWQLISWVANENMLARDDADHTRLRKLVSKAFTPRRVEEMRGRVASLTDALLDDMAGSRGEVELKEALARPVPMGITADLFGVADPEDRAELARLIGLILDQSITPEVAGRTHLEVQAYLAGLVARKRGEPGDDLTSALIDARSEDEDRLSEPELVWTLILIIGAGFETTMNLIVNAVRALLTHPDQLRMVRGGEYTWDDVIEETLRWDTSIHNIPLRYAAEDLEVQGSRIGEGEAILVGYGAAGRDPDRYGATAHLFDITREDKAHLSFSHGPHYCLGANLARLELGVVLPKLFERFPRMSLAGAEPEELPSIVSGGVTALPVRLDAGAPSGAPTA